MEIAITLAEYDIETGRLLRLVAEPYSGPWALCKNDNSKRVTKEAEAASAAAQKTSSDQLALANALISRDEKAFQSWLDGQGFAPETQAAMLSQFRNSVSASYGSGMANLKQQLAQRGGYQPGGFGGTDVGRIAGFEANQARTLSAGELGLNLYADQQNAARKEFAGTLYGALGGEYNRSALGYADVGSSYLGTASGAARQADAPSPLFGVLSSLIGAGASVGAAALKH